MKAMILVLFAFLALVYSQNVNPGAWSKYTAWTADFICTAPQFGTGFFKGKCTYDWSIGAFSLVFEGTEVYSEFYQFNTDRGYKQDSPSGQFAFQYLYKSSKSCPCETTGLNFAMPAFFTGAEKMSSISGINYWTGQTPNDGTLSTGPADKWIASPEFTITINGQPKSYTIASFFWLRGEIPSGFNINDFQRRTFALENIVEGTPGQLGLIAPKSGCKCGKQMDVVLSLDRSGSISRDQWNLEYQFTQNLVNAFTYGPLATNLGIVNWNAATWPTLALTSGISDTVVKSAVGSMTCCPGASSSSCCCCGTPIGGGIRVGANMLTQSTRGKAQKVLILLTDGCQNHLWDPKANKGISCGCANEKACATNATCVGDITVNYKYVEENIPGTRVIAVGVGGADTICKEQLQLAAGGDPLNVYTPSSWSQLLTLVETITATACTADNALCPGCCGICTCGQCIPPPNCMDPNKCNKGVLDSTGCCGTQPITCAREPCKFEYCDDKQGCLYDPIECPPDETCVTYVCNNSFTCDATKKTNPDGSDIAACVSIPVYKCVDNTRCNDKDNCTTDVCVNPSTDASDCTNTRIDCKESTSDECVRYFCRRDVGCMEEKKTCDDKNLCTVDSCDPKKGCVFTNITCPKPNNTCEYVICDQWKGCTYLPIDCTKAENGGLKAENCTVPACDKDPKVGCYDQFICAAPPPTSTETGPDTVVLVSTLTTAAVAGIVCAAVLLAAGLGGGAAVAVAQMAGAGGAVTTASNPLYAGSGIGGDNPLNQG